MFFALLNSRTFWYRSNIRNAKHCRFTFCQISTIENQCLAISVRSYNHSWFIELSSKIHRFIWLGQRNANASILITYEFCFPGILSWSFFTSARWITESHLQYCICTDRNLISNPKCLSILAFYPQTVGASPIFAISIYGAHSPLNHHA